MSNKFYVTTPIYYVNDKPHIGSTYTTVIADVLARTHRLRGDKTWFLTGTDENSQKNLEASQKAGFKDMSAYLDSMAQVWQTTWRTLGLTFDDFIRTTEERHHKGVEHFWRAVQQSGDIYKAEYERDYCVGCEAFKTAHDLTDGRCPLHPNKELEKVKEENYFFRASAYKNDLLKLYHEHPEFIEPKSRMNEIRSYVKDVFEDFSISRESGKIACGIPVPDDTSQRIYVWFDALLNYMTAVGYGTDDKLFKKWWPADVHLIGKDIIKFHCALWPAMLMSASKSDPSLLDEKGNVLLPKSVHVNGFFTVDGQKISKSLGNAIDPLNLAKAYPFDVIRYFILREIPYGEDGDFSKTRLAERYNSDLANTLGNLVNRSVAMSRKYFDGHVPDINPEATKTALPDTEWGGAECLEILWQTVDRYLDSSRADLALDSVWSGKDCSLNSANRYVEQTKPFRLIKEDPEKAAVVLYTLLEACRHFAWMIYPMMPDIAHKIITQLGQDPETEIRKTNKELRQWGGLAPNSELPEPTILFPRLTE